MRIRIHADLDLKYWFCCTICFTVPYLFISVPCCIFAAQFFVLPFEPHILLSVSCCPGSIKYTTCYRYSPADSLNSQYVPTVPYLYSNLALVVGAWYAGLGHELWTWPGSCQLPIILSADLWKGCQWPGALGGAHVPAAVVALLPVSEQQLQYTLRVRVVTRQLISD